MLIQDCIRIFEEANRTINKRRKAKKTQIQQRGVFNVQNANTLLNVREMDMQLKKEMCTNGRSQGGGRTTVRCCSNCSEPGHNTRIYKKDEEISNVYSSE